ncbi:hypothetical protein [Vreelandella sp.]|uniref:hypothetical protein n=1 Tax=Vreelandella sp. TaxID=3137778 RepID=UPI003BAA82B2
MSFKITQAETVTVPVPYTDPIQGPKEFKATWKLHPWKEYRAIVDAQQAGTKADEELLEDLVSLEGIEDSETKEKIQHCQALVDAAMSVTFIRRPLILSWFAAQEGRSRAATKN